MTHEYGTDHHTSEQPGQPGYQQPNAEQSTNEQSTNEQPTTEGRTRTEEFKVSGENLLAKVRELINEGNVRRITISNDDGRTLLEVPLSAGLAVTAVAAVFAPVLVAVGAIAALVTSVTVGVVRGPEKATEAASTPAEPVVAVDPIDPAATDSNHGTSQSGYSI